MRPAAKTRTSPRQSSIRFAFLAIAGAIVFGCAEAPDPPLASYPRTQRPVILYLVDTLRADRLGCYGHERDTSPRIDAFSSESVLFERCQAQSSWTKPATASLLTGHYPASHGANHRQRALSPTVVSIAQRFQTAGYATGAFVANGFIFDKSAGFDRGFETFERYHAEKVEGELIEHARAEGILTDALAWVAAKGSKPFFLYIHLVDPHGPYGAPEPYGSRYVSTYDGSIDGGYGVTYRPLLPATSLTESDWQHLRNLYDGEVAYSDAQFGRFVDGLKDLGIFGGSVIAFVSDHGEEFFDHRFFGHPPGLFQEILNVPLVIRFPEAPKRLRGMRQKRICRQIDVLPTLLDAIGITVPRSEIDGVSLLPQLLGEKPKAEIFAVSEVDKDGVFRKAIVHRNLKYIREWSPLAREFLFDLAEDPKEKNNLIKQRPSDARRMRGLLDAYVVRISRGYSLVYRNRTDEMQTVRAIVRTKNSPLRSVFTRYAEDRKGSPGTGDLPINQKEITWQGEHSYIARAFFRTAPSDIDGLEFDPDPESDEIEVYITVDGKPAAPTWIFLGEDGHHPKGNPFVIDTARADDLIATDPTAGNPTSEKIPCSIRLWKMMGVRTAVSEMDEETRANLRALGYLDE